MDIMTAHHPVMDHCQRKMNVMLVVVTTLAYGAHGMSILVMLNVVMETDVAPELANRIPTDLQVILTAHQCVTDPMRTMKNATQDAVTRTRDMVNGPHGSVM